RPAHGAVGDPGEGAVTLAQVGARRRETPPGAPAPPQSPAPRPAPRPFAIVYVLPSDGMLRTLNAMNGADAESPVPFLPPHTNARGLIIVDDVAYVATARGCGGAPDGIWALDLGAKQVTTWRAPGGIAGALGPAVAPDRTIYVTTGDGQVIALEPRTLKQRRAYRSGGPAFVSSSVIFDHRGRLLIAAASRDGRVRMLDSRGTAFIRTPLVAHAAAPAAVALASWADTNDTRWLLMPGGALRGAIVAWKVAQHDTVPTLQSGWMSGDMPGPLAAAVVNDVIFAVSGGARASSPAVLHALDGATGKELWTSGTTIPTGGRTALSAGGRPAEDERARRQGNGRGVPLRARVSRGALPGPGAPADQSEYRDGDRAGKRLDPAAVAGRRDHRVPFTARPLHVPGGREKGAGSRSGDHRSQARSRDVLKV